MTFIVKVFIKCVAYFVVAKYMAGRIIRMPYWWYIDRRYLKRITPKVKKKKIPKPIKISPPVSFTGASAISDVDKYVSGYAARGMAQSSAAMFAMSARSAAELQRRAASQACFNEQRRHDAIVAQANNSVQPSMIGGVGNGMARYDKHGYLEKRGGRGNPFF